MIHLWGSFVWLESILFIYLFVLFSLNRKDEWKIDERWRWDTVLGRGAWKRRKIDQKILFVILGIEASFRSSIQCVSLSFCTTHWRNAVDSLVAFSLVRFLLPLNWLYLMCLMYMIIVNWLLMSVSIFLVFSSVAFWFVPCLFERARTLTHFNQQTYMCASSLSVLWYCWTLERVCVRVCGNRAQWLITRCCPWAEEFGVQLNFFSGYLFDCFCCYRCPSSLSLLLMFDSDRTIKREKMEFRQPNVGHRQTWNEKTNNFFFVNFR